MTCIRTGAWIYLTEYGLYAKCDAHRFDFLSRELDCSIYAFRIVSTTPTPVEHIHFTVHSIAEWWDRAPQHTRNPSTLLSYSVTDYGYAGILNEAFS